MCQTALPLALERIGPGALTQVEFGTAAAGRWLPGQDSNLRPSD